MAPRHGVVRFHLADFERVAVNRLSADGVGQRGADLIIVGHAEDEGDRRRDGTPIGELGEVEQKRRLQRRRTHAIGRPADAGRGEHERDRTSEAHRETA